MRYINTKLEHIVCSISKETIHFRNRSSIQDIGEHGKDTTWECFINILESGLLYGLTRHIIPQSASCYKYEENKMQSITKSNKPIHLNSFLNETLPHVHFWPMVQVMFFLMELSVLHCLQFVINLKTFDTTNAHLYSSKLRAIILSQATTHRIPHWM